MTNPIAELIGKDRFDLLMTEGVKPAVGICMPSSCSPQELEVHIIASANMISLAPSPAKDYKEI